MTREERAALRAQILADAGPGMRLARCDDMPAAQQLELLDECDRLEHTIQHVDGELAHARERIAQLERELEAADERAIHHGDAL